MTTTPAHCRGIAARGRRSAGFTLLELTIALVLLALLSAVLFGSLKLAGQSSSRGEAKADATSSMRLAEEFLRTNLEAQHPLRMRRMSQFPLLFTGTADELVYASELPARVAAGGVWLFRLRVLGDDPKSPLVLERTVPDVAADAMPEFHEADRSVLADGIAKITIGYYGRDPGALANATEPTWRDHWDDPQRLPLLIRVDVTPLHGDPWPRLVVTPREAPEAGCRAWNTQAGICVGV
ncbi:MAG TPA: prepilin-type N-terminal cleavage/methylation domain-containing protein [Casimicrobiaceae bacterium]